MESLEVTNFQRVVRILQCTKGRLDFEMDRYPRFDYGTIVHHAMLGNFPQAFSHLAMINTAVQLQDAATGGSSPGPDRT